MGGAHPEESALVYSPVALWDALKLDFVIRDTIRRSLAR
jgi:hypothetical protein